MVMQCNRRSSNAHILRSPVCYSIPQNEKDAPMDCAQMRLFIILHNYCQKYARFSIVFVCEARLENLVVL